MRSAYSSARSASTEFGTEILEVKTLPVLAAAAGRVTASAASKPCTKTSDCQFMAGILCVVSGMQRNEFYRTLQINSN